MTATEVIVRAAASTDVDAILSIYRPIVNEKAISFEESPPDSAELGCQLDAPQACAAIAPNTPTPTT